MVQQTAQDTDQNTGQRAAERARMQDNAPAAPAPWDAALTQIGEGFSRIAVEVTFLRMGRRPSEPAPPLPPGYEIHTVMAPTVAFYRFLYATVGQDYCWWLRRTAPDDELSRLLADPQVWLHVLYYQGQPGGFFELDGRYGGEVNLSYFGLMPHLLGKGIGAAFLRAAIDAAWTRVRPRPGAGIRVNTCTADHPRALGAYIRAGFRPIRTIRETWNIPAHLGLPVPAALRV